MPHCGEDYVFCFLVLIQYVQYSTYYQKCLYCTDSRIVQLGGTSPELSLCCGGCDSGCGRRSGRRVGRSPLLLLPLARPHLCRPILLLRFRSGAPHFVLRHQHCRAPAGAVVRIPRTHDLTGVVSELFFTVLLLPRTGRSRSGFRCGAGREAGAPPRSRSRSRHLPRREQVCTSRLLYLDYRVL